MKPFSKWSMDNGGRLLDRLDRRPAWQFVAILYVARWVVLAPVIALGQLLFTASQKSAATVPADWHDGPAVGLFLGLVVVPPLAETLVACTLPYWVMSWLRSDGVRQSGRWWGFVGVSAGVMAVLHPMVAALLPAFITGAFLAYCYAHFAPSGVVKAILATTIFHGAINAIGWVLIVSN